MTDRPTQETDAVKFRIEDSNHFAVHVVHARRLERERDDLLDRLTALEHSTPIELAKLERERDEALEAAEKAKAFKRVMKEDSAKLRRELDELNKRLIEASSLGVDLLIQREEFRREFAAERVLADRLANSLTSCERWVNQPCDVKTEADKVLMEWKEARK